jgi:hypothetical protein
VAGVGFMGGNCRAVQLVAVGWQEWVLLVVQGVLVEAGLSVAVVE